MDTFVQSADVDVTKLVKREELFVLTLKRISLKPVVLTSE